jgi:hypothetical protein
MPATRPELSADEIKCRAKTTVEEFNGIIAYNEAFYLISISMAAESSILAYERFLLHLWQSPDLEAFAHFLDFLTQTAATSRYFWPAKSSQNKAQNVTDARAKKLQTAFGLGQKSPLRDRTLRNVIEHYDEYLDRFLLRGLVGPILPSPIITSENLQESEIGYAFQFVNPVYEYAVLLGVRGGYDKIIPELKRVLTNARKMLDDGGRLPSIPTTAAPSSI